MKNGEKIAYLIKTSEVVIIIKITIKLIIFSVDSLLAFNIIIVNLQAPKIIINNPSSELKNLVKLKVEMLEIYARKPCNKIIENKNIIVIKIFFGRKKSLNFIPL